MARRIEIRVFNNKRLNRTVIDPLNRADAGLGVTAALVLQDVVTGWPSPVDERALLPYHPIITELYRDELERGLERCLSVLAYRGFIVRYHVGDRRLVRAIPGAL